MPTTSWAEPFESCARRVLEVIDASAVAAELIVVYDGKAERRPAWLRRPGVRVLQTRHRRGPAAARNMGVARARGAILFFIDADVEIASDAIDRVHAALSGDDSPVALFGAYDDSPAATGVVSRFRNLLHHHTHIAHPGRAGTFWAGCGAIRAAYFNDIGGFDERYDRPSVEDIELGMRLASRGGRIVLDPRLQGKHHKRWTLRSMIVTDVASRAIPWTRLMLASRHVPATLNIDWKNRVSGMLAVAGVLAVASVPFASRGFAVAVACFAAVMALNLDFYRVCFRRGGLAFATAAFGLHCLFFVYSSLTFGIVVAEWLLFGGRAAKPHKCAV